MLLVAKLWSVANENRLTSAARSKNRAGSFPCIKDVAIGTVGESGWVYLEFKTGKALGFSKGMSASE